MSSSNSDLFVTKPMTARQWAEQFDQPVAPDDDKARWDIPELDQKPVGPPLEEDPEVQEQLAALREQAHAEGLEQGKKEGFEQGYQAGMDAAQADIDAQKAHLKDWLTHLSQPLAQLDEEVNEQLVALSTQIARVMIARELQIDRSGLAEIATEAMQAMPVATRSLTLFCHPDDQAALQQLAEADPRLEIQVSADAQIQPGGLVVEAGAARVDAQLANRWADLLESMIGRCYPGPDEPLATNTGAEQQQEAEQGESIADANPDQAEEISPEPQTQEPGESPTAEDHPEQVAEPAETETELEPDTTQAASEPDAEQNQATEQAAKPGAGDSA